ncbi:MAG: hexitol phosphatase HxpB [Actinomycetota bacterium]|nr:hexitol phosphatase HxpB [Actinomycetota bacterium]
MAFVDEATVVAHHPAARAAIFDMDGLLVDTEPFWRDVEAGVFDALGADVRPLLAHGLTAGMRVDEAVAFFRARLGIAGADDAAVGARIVAGVVAAIEGGAELKPGAVEALDLLEGRGLALALASGSAMAVIDAVLDRFSLHSRFRFVATALDDPLGKPNPAVFLRTAASLGVEPAECVVLEDSLNGCVAAKAARMRVIAVPEAHNRADGRFVLADLRLDSLVELASVDLDRLLGVPVGGELADRS